MCTSFSRKAKTNDILLFSKKYIKAKTTFEVVNTSLSLNITSSPEFELCLMRQKQQAIINKHHGKHKKSLFKIMYNYVQITKKYYIVSYIYYTVVNESNTSIVNKIPAKVLAIRKVPKKTFVHHDNDLDLRRGKIRM